jgi:hypothetical protein
MREEFKPVEVIKSFLGIKKGTILKFDEMSSKYISREREEEIGDDYEYYSGNAIEIDPTIINRNLGKYFEIYEIEIEKPIEVPVEEVYPVGDKELVTIEQDKEESRDTEVDVVAEFNPPDNAISLVQGGELKFECGLCHFQNDIAHIKYGLFFPASDKTSLKLKCSNCGIETNLYYKMDNDETAKESK